MAVFNVNNTSGIIVRDVVGQSTPELYFNGVINGQRALFSNKYLSEGYSAVVSAWIATADCGNDENLLVYRDPADYGFVREISYAFKVADLENNNAEGNFIPEVLKFRVPLNSADAYVNEAYYTPSGDESQYVSLGRLWSLPQIQCFNEYGTSVPIEHTIVTTGSGLEITVQFETFTDPKSTDPTNDKNSQFSYKYAGTSLTYRITWQIQPINELVNYAVSTTCFAPTDSGYLAVLLSDLEVGVELLEMSGKWVTTDTGLGGNLYVQDIELVHDQYDSATKYESNFACVSGYIPFVTGLGRFERIQRAWISFDFDGDNPTDILVPFSRGVEDAVPPLYKDAPELFGYTRGTPNTGGYTPVFFSNCTVVDNNGTYSVSGDLTFLQAADINNQYYVSHGDFYQYGDALSGLTIRGYGLPQGTISNPKIYVRGEGGQNHPSGNQISNNVRLHTIGSSPTAINKTLNIVQNPSFTSGNLNLFLSQDPIEEAKLPLFIDHGVSAKESPTLYSTGEVNAYYFGATRFDTVLKKVNSTIPIKDGYYSKTYDYVPSFGLNQYDSNYSGVVRQYQNTAFIGSNESDLLVIYDSEAISHKIVYFSLSWSEVQGPNFKNRIFQRSSIKIEADNVLGRKSLTFHNESDPLGRLVIDFVGVVEIALVIHSYDDYDDMDVYVGNANYPMYYLGSFSYLVADTASTFARTTPGTSAYASDVLTESDKPIGLHSYIILDGDTNPIEDLLALRSAGPAKLNSYLDTSESLIDVVENDISSLNIDGSAFPKYQEQRLVPFLSVPFDSNFEFFGSELNKNAISLSFDCSGNFGSSDYIISGYYGLGSQYPTSGGMISGSVGWNYNPNQFIAKFMHSGKMDSFRRINLNPYELSGTIANNSNSGVLKLGVYPIGNTDDQFHLSNFNIDVSGSRTLLSGNSNVDLFTIAPATPINNDFDITLWNQQSLNNVDLFLYANDGSGADVDLYQMGAQPVTTSLHLYQSGNFQDFGSLSLYTSGNYQDFGALNLYTSGKGADNGIIPLNTLGASSVHNGITNLYLSGFNNSSSSCDFYIYGSGVKTSNNLNLYVDGLSLPNSFVNLYTKNGISGNKLDLFLKNIDKPSDIFYLHTINDASVNKLDLFVKSMPIASGVTDLYVHNIGYDSAITSLMVKNQQNNNNVNLYTYGKDVKKDHIDLYMQGHLNQLLYRGLPLHMASMASGGKTINLYTENIPYSESSGIDLYIDSSFNLGFETSGAGYWGKTLNLITESKDNARGINLVTFGPSSASELFNINLFMSGDNRYYNTVPLSLNNQDIPNSGAWRRVYLSTAGRNLPTSGGMNLYLERIEGVYNTLNCMINADYSENDLNLYQSGSIKISTDLNLCTSGQGKDTKTIKVITRGF